MPPAVNSLIASGGEELANAALDFRALAAETHAAGGDKAIAVRMRRAGGLSGASLDRPALQNLLADVRTGKITIVVVYKVDRLTRSLADFAKLVEMFDEYGVSFVSITQCLSRILMQPTIANIQARRPEPAR
jgi:Resolvase, N terminal domain